MNLMCLCGFKETIHWNPPHLLYVTLNTDDSAKTNPGKARAVGVIRDHNGKWLKGFSINLGITSNNIAQLWVVMVFSWLGNWVLDLFSWKLILPLLFSF